MLRGFPLLRVELRRAAADDPSIIKRWFGVNTK